MIKRHSEFDPEQCANKLRQAAADLRRHAPGCALRSGLATRLDRHASAILRPDILTDLEGLMAARLERLTRASA